jgi:DNA-directed RNA polymerase I, II, and III subunit RPABC2
MSDEEEEVYEEEVEEEEEDEEDEDEVEDESIYDDEPSLGDVEIQAEEEEEIEHPYKTKFNDNLRNEYLQKYHPEELHKTFEEIYKLSLVTRDDNGVIVDDLHKTYPILSKYEKAKIIGLRVSQLNKGARPYIKLERSVIDNTLIAEKELREKKIPFIIMRPIPNGTAEYWNLSDLEYIY